MLWIPLLILYVSVALVVILVWYVIWTSRRKKHYSPFTEDTLRLPGHSIRKAHGDQLDKLISLFLEFVISTGGVILAVFFLSTAMKWIVIALSVAYMLWTAYRTVKLFHKARKLGLGKEAEEYTGQELNLLMTKGAFVFHDLPYQYGNIDHVVVGLNNVLVVETKAVKKPSANKEGNSRIASVRFDGTTLQFPRFETTEPIKQANIHAKHLREVIQKKCGFDYPVIPVVALPGWHIEVEGDQRYNTIVINPKRAKALFKWLGSRDDKFKRDLVANYIASVARSVSQASKLSDPNASEKYDFWLNPRYQDKKLGD